MEYNFKLPVKVDINFYTLQFCLQKFEFYQRLYKILLTTGFVLDCSFVPLDILNGSGPVLKILFFSGSRKMQILMLF